MSLATAALPAYSKALSIPRTCKTEKYYFLKVSLQFLNSDRSRLTPAVIWALKKSSFLKRLKSWILTSMYRDEIRIKIAAAEWKMISCSEWKFNFGSGNMIRRLSDINKRIYNHLHIRFSMHCHFWWMQTCRTSRGKKFQLER